MATDPAQPEDGTDGDSARQWFTLKTNLAIVVIALLNLGSTATRPGPAAGGMAELAGAVVGSILGAAVLVLAGKAVWVGIKRIAGRSSP